jgi:hypothetical protein
MNDPSGFFVRFRPAAAFFDRTVHDIDSALVPNLRLLRVSRPADAIHHGLRDSAMPTTAWPPASSTAASPACFRIAHDGARPRRRPRFGTAGRLAMGESAA